MPRARVFFEPRTRNFGLPLFSKPGLLLVYFKQQLLRNFHQLFCFYSNTIMPMSSRRLIFLTIVLGSVSGWSVLFANEHLPDNIAVAATDTFYVSPAGSNTTGTGVKNNPWRTITFALNQLNADSLNPKVIKLPTGILGVTATGESFPIKLKSWISLLGNGSSNTIIDANQSARAVFGQNVTGVSLTALTLRNGFAKLDTGESSRGGGILLRNCRKIVIKDCRLRANEAKTLGGGVLLDGGADILLENNLLENNIAFDGAGVYCQLTKSARLLANIIQQNAAKNSAGGVYINLAAPTLQRNRIRGNSASRTVAKNAGGIMVHSSNPLIGGAQNAGNDIHDNIGGVTGAQLYVIDNTTPVNARYNYWGAVPGTHLVYPANFVDLSNYRNLANNITLGATEFYIAPGGSNDNNGSINSPWRTLGYAFSQIFATDLDSLTIKLAPGIYSIATNGEQFPIYPKSNIAVIGSTTSATTIFGGANVFNTELMRLESIAKLRLANLTFRNYKPNIKSSVILARFSKDVLIENCVFQDNQSSRGAAITFIRVKSSEIRHNIFRRNRSTGHGGALALLEDATVLTGNIFTDNNAANGGGAVHCDSTSVTQFIKNEFRNNSAAFGGALYFTLSNTRLINNRLIANHATVAGGGAIALDGGSLPQIGTRDTQANDIYLNTAVLGGSQIHRFEIGIKVDARYNYWGQIPDSTLLAPSAQFSSDNFRQVASRMPANTKTIYVSPAGNDAATGTSRTQALRTIDEALRLVFGIDKSPLTVQLLPGKFSSATNAEIFPVPLESYIAIRGVTRDSVTIDAANQARVFEGRDVVGSTIADLNIIGGKASGFGGAILVKTGTNAAIKKAVATTIENSSLQNNTATHGGAIAAWRNFKTLIRNCVINNNSAQQNGGAVWAVGDSVEIKDSEFFVNRAQQNGGAVNVDSAAVVTLTNNRIHDNSAAQGGGVSVLSGLGRIWRNFLIDNTAANGGGGGIYLGTSGKATIGGVASNGNDIYGNRASKPGKELSSAPRGGKIDARFNFFGGKPTAALVDDLSLFDISSYRNVTITVPEKNREFYLSPKGNDSNTGINKNSPWKTINAALRRFFTEPGDSVQLNLLAGVYSAKTTGEKFPLYLPHRVALVGQHADSVIFDGERNTRLFEINFALRVRLQNLSILNGNYNESGLAWRDLASRAGGVRIHKSAFVYLHQIVFRGNNTVGEGGALAADSSQQIYLSQCRFLENQGHGGAIYYHRVGGEIRACEFRQNRSLDNGAAIYLNEATPQISSNSIVGNEVKIAESHGAIFCKGNAVPIIGGGPGEGNDIFNNTGGVRGLALAREGTTPIINATHNYFGAGQISETQVFPLAGFDLRFNRDLPITANSKPVITQVAPATNPPLRAGLSDTVKFKVQAFDPDNDLLTYTWTLNEVPAPVGYSANYEFYPFTTGLRENTVRVVVSDQRDTVTVNWKVLVSTTDINDSKPALPKAFALQQNFPNPVRSASAMMVIPFQIPQQSDVTLTIYDLLGRRVRLLEQGLKPAGFHQTLWNGFDDNGVRVENGIYFVRLQAGTFVAKQKIVMMR